MKYLLLAFLISNSVVAQTIIKDQTIQGIQGGVSNVTYDNCVFTYSVNLYNYNLKNIKFLNCKFVDIPTDHYLRLRNKTKNIEVTGCLFYRTKLTVEQLGIQVKGSGKNLLFRDNTFINLTDGIQTTPNPSTHPFDPNGFVDSLYIYDNVIISNPNYYGVTENGLDFKTGSSDSTKLVQVYNNIISGYYPSPTSSGDAILIQVDAQNYNVYNNTIINSTHQLKLEQYNVNWVFKDRNIWFNGVHKSTSGINYTQYF